MNRKVFKEDNYYYAEMKSHGKPSPLLNVFKVISIFNNGLWTLLCVPLVSNWNAGWSVV